MAPRDPYEQDWQTVTLHCPKDKKSHPDRDGDGGRDKDRDAARRATVSIVTGQPAWKVEQAVDSDTGEGLKRTPRDDARAIVAARVAQKLSQAGLAQRLNLPIQVIRDIELGKAIDNRALLARIRKELAIR